MKDLKLSSEKDLMKFLKIVAQESYKKSIKESYINRYEDQFDLDSKRFGKLNTSSRKKLDEEEEEGLFDLPDTDGSESSNDMAKQNPIEDEEDAIRI